MGIAASYPVLPPDVDPATTEVAVGGYVCSAEPIEYHAELPVTTLSVRNTGDRPVQVGSHFHFFEVNAGLEFEREQAYGFRLDVPSGTALRFEPGDERQVELVPFGGKRAAFGFNNLVDGPTAGKSAEEHKARAVALAAERGFRSAPEKQR